MEDESLLIESLIITAANSTAASTISFTGSGILLPFAGSALVGYIIGFALGLGVLAGIIFIVIQWMANNGYIQGVRWDKLGADISSYGQHLETANVWKNGARCDIDR